MFSAQDSYAYGSRGGRKSMWLKLARRANSIPPDEVLKLLPSRKRFKHGKWTIEAHDLRLLALARNPKLQMADISAILNCEFNKKTEHFFEKAGCQSRLNWLRRMWAEKLKEPKAPLES